MSCEVNPFNQFSEAFHRWSSLPRPVGDLHNSQVPTYPIELDLDHEASYLASIGVDALTGNTKIDWPKIAPEYISDLKIIENNVNLAPIPDEQKQKYKKYIAECLLVWEKISLLPVSPDGHLGFRKYVLSEFRFLEKQYEFRVTQTTPIKVRYESSELFVELNHSPGVPEQSFELGRLRTADEPQQCFSLDDLLYWAGLGLRFDYDRFDLESSDDLSDFIANAAQFVEQHAGPTLRNDPSCFYSLVAKQAERERHISEELEP